MLMKFPENTGEVLVQGKGTDLRILPCVLTNPTQQNLLTVGLLKARHHILHHILYLHTNTTYCIAVV